MNQLGSRQDYSAQPVQLRIQPGLSRNREVGLDLVKGDEPGDVLMRLGHAAQEPTQKGRVGHLVLHRGSGRQRPILDSQVGLSLPDSIAGTVPAVDGAVEEAEGLEPGHFVSGKDFKRILGALIGHQGSEAGDVLLKDLQYRVADPLVAEADARPGAADMGRGPPSVDGALEKGDARFFPQSLPQQEGRIGGGRQHRSRHQLGDVVELGEPVGGYLVVDLKGGIASLQHDGVALQHQLVDALDV